jgi:hypothetical protein
MLIGNIKIALLLYYESSNSNSTFTPAILVPLEFLSLYLKICPWQSHDNINGTCRIRESENPYF